MGKKKQARREREAREQAAGHTGAQTGHKADRKHDGAAPLAGIAAAVARQMATPAGRQVIAAGLMMAANAITAKDARGAAPRQPEPPTPPKAPASPDAAATGAGTGPFAGDTPTPPRSDAPALPPELAKVIESVASGLERFAAGFTKPIKPEAPKA